MGTPATPARGRGHARRLDRAQILEAARGLARSGGPAGVTMRAIARALDVDVAALYWHFESKAALLDALAAFAAGREPLTIAKRGGWKTRTRAVCRAIRDRLREQPELRLAGSGALAPFTAQSVAALCRALHGCGLPEEGTLFAAQTLVQTLFGVVATEAAQAAADPAGARAYVDDLAQNLPEPLVASWRTMARRNPRDTFDAFFEDAVAIVIAGIEARGAR